MQGRAVHAGDGRDRDLHAESVGKLTGSLADFAHTDDTEGFASQFDLRVLPVAEIDASHPVTAITPLECSPTWWQTSSSSAIVNCATASVE